MASTGVVAPPRLKKGEKEARAELFRTLMGKMPELSAWLREQGDVANRCHEISLALVRTGLLGEPGVACRVARGGCRGITSQHSWAVVGDPHLRSAIIVDPTFTATTAGFASMQMLYNEGKPHIPHAWGSIWNYGRPAPATGPVIQLKPAQAFSDYAQSWLEMLGPLDRRGWGVLAHAPALGWPAKEILTAMAHDSRLAALIPIDHLGMLTDLNPESCYW